MSTYKLFTSESVSEGHPDKIADQISDTILDAILHNDPEARVGIETLVKTGMIVLAGEVTTTTYVDIEELVRDVIIDIGYDKGELGFDGHCVAVLNAIGKQSPDIAQGITHADAAAQGAGDQGMMFGYATNETNAFMPAPIFYAHKLMKKQATLRKQGVLNWLRPDAKSQITMRYHNAKPVGIDAVVFSTQHTPDISMTVLKEMVMEEIIKPTLPAHLLHRNTRYYINPTGAFIIGGPVGDCGVTGRKNIVDTYGGMARHGGGSFSGKDPSKVDRSGAYACRYVAKNIVAAGLASRCEIQIAYAIGIAHPLSIVANTFGTGILSDEKLSKLIYEFFDLTPYGIIHALKLKRPIYRATSTYGHFGRTEEGFSWEKTDKAQELSFVV